MARSPNILPAKVTVCLQCGDRGYANALVYCVECLEFAVHRYCLDNIPDTFDEFVKWICDDCKAKVPNELIVRNCEITNDVSPGEVHGRVSGSFDPSHDAQAIVASNIQAQPKKLNLVEKHNATSLVVEEVGQKQLSGSFGQPCVDSVGCNTEAQPKKLNLVEKHNATSLVVEEEGQRQLSGPFSQPCVEPGGCNTEAQLAACCEPGLPVIDIIWQGCFKICNKDYDIFDGLVAHLSVTACVKVYKEASSFPPMLKLEMLSKSAVWPKSFHTSEPTDQNIALYFFPADTKCERNFDYLVEIMMREELALKAVLKNAELLIFTSQELPLLYWRFQGKYYLWGVFRGREQSK